MNTASQSEPLVAGTCPAPTNLVEAYGVSGMFLRNGFPRTFFCILVILVNDGLYHSSWSGQRIVRELLENCQSNNKQEMIDYITAVAVDYSEYARGRVAE